MEKFERKYLIHLIDVNPLGDPSTAIYDETNYRKIGEDLESYSEELNPDVTTKKNILGEQTVVFNGYTASSDVDPFYAYKSDELGEKLLYIGNNRCTGKECNTTKIDVLINSSGTVLWAYREDVVVVPKSIGGDTSGVQIPFSINNNGNRVKGTFDLNTKKFTSDGENPAINSD